MSVEFESAKRLDALKQGIEAKTGGTYADLTDGVNALIAGYGQGGDDDFVGIKYSNYETTRNLPRTADASSLDKVLISSTGNSDVGNVLNFAFANSTKNGNGGYFHFLEEVYLPSKTTAMHSTFQHCVYLKTIHGDISNITSLNGAFQTCVNLDIYSLIKRMLNLVTVGNLSFADCTQITKIALPATITTIHSGAFKGCTNITDIYVPWEEGAVANAPWGATNATIHYNTTYDENGDPIE